MKVSIFHLLFLAGLSVISAQEDLSGRAFLFLNDSSENCVIVRPLPEKPLEKLTICLRFYTDLTRTYSLFSYETDPDNSEILIVKTESGDYAFFLGGDYVIFKVPNDPTNWEHVCFAWESTTGTVEFWMNGKPWPRKGMKKGYTVPAAAFILLGKEQDRYWGSSGTFSGELADVYVWDFLLSPYPMRSTYHDFKLPPCILCWKDLQYEVKGDVIVKARLK
ncbi:serum amyloid P-component-like [Sphaerodactylus townsendi]|uniref:Uncharacterized protein n=1 Tax=Sphaerodactylus townsendi TaxID=933632 RepID=A0ACB8G7V1_9SAUR|nr:serum amyloid P-component-like [Sphaerodactylus townsendi]